MLPPPLRHELAPAEGGPQLPRHLAPQRVPGRFARLELAAGELPESRQVAARASLGDEIAAGAVTDEGGGDLDDERHDYDRAWPARVGNAAQERRIGQGAQRGRRGVHQVAPKSMSAWLRS